MNPNLRFGVVTTMEDLQKAGEFAASFDHEITQKSTFPIVTISRGDRMFGYYNVLRQPVIFPAFSTDQKVCSPRDFKDGFEAVRNHLLQSSMSHEYPRGVAFFGMPGHIVEKYGKKTLERHLGLRTNNTILYQCNG